MSGHDPDDRQFVEVDGARPVVARWNSAAQAGAGPTIVLLHGGLAAIPLWREIPRRLASMTGAQVVAIDRPGHGEATPVPDGPWPADWLHRESARLATLLDRLGVDRPLLVGHSDGGSIALIRASDASDEVAGVVALAPHSYVEPVCVDAIRAMRRDPDRLVELLGRIHSAPAELFEAWSGVWTSEDFATWDIRPRLGSITAPTTVIQGDADEFGTSSMLFDTVESIGPHAGAELLPGVSHDVMRDRPDVVIAAVTDVHRSARG